MNEDETVGGMKEMQIDVQPSTRIEMVEAI